MTRFITINKLFATVCLLGSGMAAQSQINTELPVVKQFTSFTQRNIAEKLFVHTDKEFYLAGEIIWYKIYYMDGSFHRPLDLSKLAYVEIIDGNNKPVMQAKNALSNSTGKGSFFLPSSVNSGTFRLRAYTNWMKNSDAGYFFEKNISIVNTFKPLNIPSTTTANSFSLQLFPEGGNLVNGLESKVAFKLADQSGHETSFNGVVVDDNNDTVSAIRALKYGMGQFVFTPVNARTYKAVVTTSDGEVITASLPAAKIAGYVMKVTDSGNQMVVTINTNLPDKTSGGEVSVLAHTRQVTGFADKKVFVNGTTSFLFNKDRLGEGISHITVFNSEHQPVCERLVFKMPESQLKISSGPAVSSFKPREKVSLDITTSLDGKPVPANLSLAVYQVDSLSLPTAMDMRAYLLLSSDIRGDIRDPSYYFSTDPDVATATENLLLTQGWRRFNWTQPLRKIAEPAKYAPEFDGHIVGATVTQSNNQQPVAGLKTFMSVPGTKTQFYAAVTDFEGKAFYDIRDYYGKNEVVLQTESVPESNYRVEIIDPFSDRYSNRPFPALDINNSHQKTIRNYSIAMQTMNSFMGDSLSRFDLPVLDSLPFYGAYTKRYRLDDYVRFTTMEEVLREYVPEIGITRAAGKQRLLIADWDQKRYLEGEPLLLLDGVPVTHTQLLAYDPLKVQQMEIVTNRYVTGKFVFDGIASFKTYEGNMPDFVFDPKALILDYEGLQVEREFYSPVYETDTQRASRLPDFRNLLTWQPDINTDSSGNAKPGFYTSDKTGRFVGVLHGMDINGHATTQVFSFQVAK